MDRILVVDDERNIFEAVKKALAPLNLEMDYVSDGRKAMAQIGQETYSLLIVDLIMPAKTGYDLVTSLRSHAFAFPVVILSAHTTDDILRELGRYENLEFVSKPFKAADLLASVKRLLPKNAFGQT